MKQKLIHVGGVGHLSLQCIFVYYDISKDSLSESLPTQQKLVVVCQAKANELKITFIYPNVLFSSDFVICQYIKYQSMFLHGSIALGWF